MRPTSVVLIVLLSIGTLFVLYFNLKKSSSNNEQFGNAMSNFYDTESKIIHRMLKNVSYAPGSVCYDVPNGGSLNNFASLVQTDIVNVVGAYNDVIDGYIAGGGVSPYTQAFVPSLLKQFSQFMLDSDAYGVTITAPGVTLGSQIPTGKATMSGTVHVTQVTINGKVFSSLDISGSHVYACVDWCTAWNPDYPNSSPTVYQTDATWTPSSKTCSCGPGYGLTIEANSDAIQCQSTKSNKALSDSLAAFGSVSKLPVITPKYWGACGSVLGKDC